MKTILKYDRVILIKEMNERIKKVGEQYEIANVLDDSFLLRDSKTRTAVGVVSFEDFEKHFVKEENVVKGWTPWTSFNGFDSQNDCFYRTNGKKVQVKFLTDKVRAEASCNKKEDEFNLTFGIHMAYLRCLNKALRKKRDDINKKMDVLEKEFYEVSHDIAENINIMERMIESLV